MSVQSSMTSEFQQVAICQLQKIAISLGALPDISEKLGILCAGMHMGSKPGKRKTIYTDAINSLKKEKHDPKKGVLELSSEGECEDEDEDEGEEDEDEDEDEDEGEGEGEGEEEDFMDEEPNNI